MAKGIKTGGRQKGTPNKLTFQTRQLLVNVLADEYENLPELLQNLPASDRIDAICKLSKFVLPVMKPSTADSAEYRSLQDPDRQLREIESKHEMMDVFI